MAIENSSSNIEQARQETLDRYYWQATCALDILIKAAPKATVVEAARLLDGGNTSSFLLRGLTYITHLINSQSVDEINETGRHNALDAVGAFTELVGRLVELSHSADCMEQAVAYPEWKAFNNAAVQALQGVNHG